MTVVMGRHEPASFGIYHHIRRALACWRCASDVWIREVKMATLPKIEMSAEAKRMLAEAKARVSSAASVKRG